MKEDIWEQLQEKLPYETSPDQTEKRKKIW